MPGLKKVPKNLLKSFQQLKFLKHKTKQNGLHKVRNELKTVVNNIDFALGYQIKVTYLTT
jgi:hypothetical protein